jgi:hypothetical protein
LIDDFKVGKLGLLTGSEGTIITDYSYEMSDSHEQVFIPKKDLKAIIRYLESV